MLYAKDIAAAIDQVVLEKMGNAIFEILVYGSVADYRRRMVNDIDMIVLASNTLTDHFPLPERPLDWYGLLKGNLRKLLINVCGSSEAKLRNILTIPCDLHVFPLTMLTDVGIRQEIIRCHWDPLFLHNAFSNLLRFDVRRGSLEPTSIRYLEEKYHANLLQ